MKKSPLLRCLAIYRQFPGLFLATGVLFLLANLGMAIHMWLVGRAVNEVQAGQLVTPLPGAALGDPAGLDFTRAWHYLYMLVGLALLRGVVQYGSQCMATYAGAALLFTIRDRILVQVQRLDLAYHSKHGIGEIITRTTRDADKVRDALSSFWTAFVDTGLILITCISLLCWYSPLLGLMPLAFVLLGSMMLLPQMNKLVELDHAVGTAYDAVNQDLSEGVHGVRVIKAFGLEPVRIQGFENQVNTFTVEASAALLYAARHLPVPQLVITMSHAWVLGYGAYLIGHGFLSVGELVSALLAANNMVMRTETVGQLMRLFSDARSSAGRIWELLDAEPQIQSGPDTLPPGPLGLKLDHVSVPAPDGGRHVLRNLSFCIKPGEIVALVGATGTGKSVLMGLLPRLVEADQGAVLVGTGSCESDSRAGWQDVRSLRTDDLRHRVHVLPQESFLYSDTLAANLRVASPNATDDELREAMRLAAADEILAGLKDGLETRIGDRGTTLSGGQRQRVCLARALLARASILGLDDATSALDATTERTVLQNIRSLRTDTRISVDSEPAASVATPRKSRSGEGNSITMLIVSSKLSTILMADRVLLLADGHIAAQGTHEELAATSEVYRDLMGIS
ncbi:MAG TPA: ABC transporter ATP-binding protein [Candidatus Methylacidiphilales bacterium]|nr:ABC transporter ATP-binding protein [Candidatus Methylacidiphilales bacterium]